MDSRSSRTVVLVAPPLEKAVIRLLSSLAVALLSLGAIAQCLSGKVSWAHTCNRFGRTTDARPTGRVIWVHAASLGELTAVRPFLEYLCRRADDLTVLITTNNPKALSVAQGWRNISAICQAAPVDSPRMTARFLKHWRPDGFVNVESEIWPNRFRLIGERGIPAVMLNARLSDRSLRRYQKLQGVAARLSVFRGIFAQSETAARNFRALGIADDTVQVCPNFKSLVVLGTPSPELAAEFERSSTLLAASTHSGEEEALLSAFAALKSERPSLRLIHAPRHLDRVGKILDLCTALGLGASRLSDGALDRDVLVIDQLGILNSLYGLARVAFVGGSLLPNIGGHTPYEPIRAGTAVVTGPHFDNFHGEYSTLQAAGGCLVADLSNLELVLEAAFAQADALADQANRSLPPFEAPEELFETVARLLEIGP